MLSSQQVEAYIQFIAAALDAMAADRANLSGCIEINARFEALREQYRQHPHSLAQCVSQLSELRKRFDELLADRLALIVDRFNKVIEQIRRSQEEKECWRDFLIRKAGQTQQTHLNGSVAIVRVRSIPSRELPQVGGSERARLEDLIRGGGCWEQVSQLSRAKLERALQKNLFAESDAEVIEQLCPSTVRYQVSSHALAG